MRFGQQLQTSLKQDWRFYYINYDDLKKSIRSPRPWDEKSEQDFVGKLESELDKVFTFQRVKSDEIVRRIGASEKEINEVVAKAKASAHQQSNGDDDPTDEDFELLGEDVSDIIADVHDLAKFTQLNYTGFQKIIKKHDKQTRWALKPAFAARLRRKPFFQANYDAFIVKLSNLYNVVRTRGNPVKGDSAAGGKQQNFVRQTTKYWVHPDNITELKLIVLKHLPVLVFNAEKEFSMDDSAITSIYYDNTDTWELYQGRLKKTEGAEAIRLRWYGGMSSETIFVERKTHREDWTGEESVKARFKLKEKNVNAYMRGELLPEQIFQREREQGKRSEKDIASDEQLAREIQYRILTRHLVPVTRSFYHRTAFQLPGDARVRISLDTELSMVREDNLDGRKRAGKNWRRMDIGVDWPFSQLRPDDVERFPYAVLEVKLQTAMGQEPPEWIRELTASHLVEAVPKFSKYIHGTATLNPDRIKLLPYWIPQMDVDIRKPRTPGYGIERPGQSRDFSTSAEADESDDDDFAQEDMPEDNEDLRRLRAARDAMEQHDLDQRRDYGTLNGNEGPNVMDIEERLAQQPLPQDDYPLYDSDDEDASEEDLEEARRVGGWHYHSTLIQHKLKSAGRKAGEIGWSLIPRPRATIMPVESLDPNVPNWKKPGELKRFKAPKGKRVHIPTRVEPKVQLATERTFLSWLDFSLILGAIAATLLNFGDSLALAAAWCFTIIALLVLFYSMALYVWRVKRIKERRPSNKLYHEKWGPSFFCLALLVAVGVSFGVRFGDGGWNGGLKDGGVKG